MKRVLVALLFVAMAGCVNREIDLRYDAADAGDVESEDDRDEEEEDDDEIVEEELDEEDFDDEGDDEEDDFDDEEDDEVEEEEEEEEDEDSDVAGRIALGNFSDRRGRWTYWVGNIPGWFVYPRTILSTELSVSDTVERFVEDIAREEGLLSARRAEADYKISGEILTMESSIFWEVSTEVEINFRLSTSDESDQRYQDVHRFSLDGPEIGSYPDTATRQLEEALEEVIKDVFEDRDFLEALAEDPD